MNMPAHLSEEGAAHIENLQTQMYEQEQMLAKLSHSLSTNPQDIPFWDLPNVLEEVCQKTTRGSLAFMIVFLVILTLIPMKVTFFRMLAFGWIDIKIWNHVIFPSLLRGKDNNNVGSVFLTLMTFCITSIVVWKWLAFV